MKDFLFKGKYLLKLDFVKEAFGAANKKAITVQIIGFILEMLVGIWAFFIDETILGTIGIMLGLFILVLLYITLKAPNNQIKVVGLKYHKDAVLSEVCFVDDSIVMHDMESKGTYRFYYNQLMKCFETKNLCVFVLGLPKTVLYVSKDSIKGGDKDELIKFIKGKIDENLKAKKKK